MNWGVDWGGGEDLAGCGIDELPDLEGGVSGLGREGLLLFLEGVS